jgi:hypothetical protein
METVVKHGILVAVAIALSAWPTFAEDEIAYRIAADRLECLLQHADNYLKSKNDMLIIAVNSCPIVEEDPFLAVTQNNAAPQIPDIVVGQLDRLIVLRKKELTCISAKFKSESNAVAYRIFPTRCEIAAEIK